MCARVSDAIAMRAMERTSIPSCCAALRPSANDKGKSQPHRPGPDPKSRPHPKTKSTAPGVPRHARQGGGAPPTLSDRAAVARCRNAPRNGFVITGRKLFARRGILAPALGIVQLCPRGCMHSSTRTGGCGNPWSWFQRRARGAGIADAACAGVRGAQGTLSRTHAGVCGSQRFKGLPSATHRREGGQPRAWAQEARPSIGRSSMEASRTLRRFWQRRRGYLFF